MVQFLQVSAMMASLYLAAASFRQGVSFDERRYLVVAASSFYFASAAFAGAGVF